MTAIFRTAVLLLAQLHQSTSFTVLQTRPSLSLTSLTPLTPSTSLAPKLGRYPTTRATSTSLKGLFDDETDASDQPSEIPPELRDEIYRAEANAPAAQGRQQRIITYVLLTLVGVTTAFFNAFLSDLRFGDGSPSTELAYYGFGWVQDNFLTNFAFTNKIGGGIGLLGAGLSGTLAEVEIRSKKENAEKIWTEMQRRKSIKEKPTSRSNRKKKKRSQLSSSKKDMTGKQKKRLSALEELMVEDEPVQEIIEQPTSDAAAEKVEEEVEPKTADGSEDGLLGKMKGFYKQADSMAASQALLLNKELEDRGVLDKITDESGLKVIGKEAASKLDEKDK